MRQLQAGCVEVLGMQPGVVNLRPRVATVVDDAVPQKRFRHPVAGRHEIPATVLSGTHQITGRLLLDAGHRHFDDLPEVQQMPRGARVVLHPISGRALQLRRCRHQTLEARRCQEPGEPEAGRPGLVGNRHRSWQGPAPVHDFAVIRCQSSFEKLTGSPVEAAGDHRSCVHIQSNTRTQ